MDFENRYKDYIIVNPLMTAGILPDFVQEKLCNDDWVKVGYSVCFDCLEGRSSLITKPPVKQHLEDVAKFFGGDVAEHTFGCRGAQFAVMNTVSELVRDGNYSNVVIADPLSHYTTNIAAEMCSLKVVEPPHSGYPEYNFTAESFLNKIEEVKKETGKPPALIAVTHVDPYYGNLAPVNEIGKICEEQELLYMINAAYTGGVLPVNMKELKADFLTVSAHKSMASLGPLGYLITTFEWSKKVFATSKQRPDWTSRAFGKKIPNIFGCSVGGIPLISSMLSFDYVKDRVNKWDPELKKIRKFSEDIENLNGIMLLGQNPHNHHLMHFETPILWEISESHKRKGFFLAEEFDKREITGIHRGLTKHIKLSVYGLSDEKIKLILDTFEDIIKRR